MSDSATCTNNCNTLKGIFIGIIFLEALLSGLFPSLNRNCRESPKCLGIANAFSGGVFIAIAFVHILPESAEGYADLKGDDAFPLPYLLFFCGYSLILLLDKVMFDTHALFDEAHSDSGEPQIADPAARKF
mmetsp:Transcript_22728/g.16097  ORF Transcript_22728/g.16097 Transcript_22728/m.16097 type:complete len:131 (-) Transcript_22728:280-672(-)